MAGPGRRLVVPSRGNCENHGLAQGALRSRWRLPGRRQILCILIINCNARPASLVSRAGGTRRSVPSERQMPGCAGDGRLSGT
jgi:hypothetical protein